MCETGKNQNSIVVVQVWPKFWRVKPMVCEGQSHKNQARNSTVAAGNRCCCGVNPKIADFKALWELACANMGQRWLKMALNHLFEHRKWSTSNFGKNHF